MTAIVVTPRTPISATLTGTLLLLSSIGILQPSGATAKKIGDRMSLDY
jgi:hypothetical protein